MDSNVRMETGSTRAAADDNGTQVRRLGNNRICSVQRSKRFGHRRVVRKRPIIQVGLLLAYRPLARPLALTMKLSAPSASFKSGDAPHLR